MQLTSFMLNNVFEVQPHCSNDQDFIPFLRLSNISFMDIWIYHICLSIHLLINIWVVSAFRLLWIRVLGTCVYKFWTYVFICLLGRYLVVELCGHMGLSRWLSGESTCQCRRHRRHEFNPWVNKVPWRRKWQPTPVFLAGNLMHRGAWGVTDHEVTKSQTQGSKHVCWWEFHV